MKTPAEPEHSADVLEVWKQAPTQLLEHEGLLPLATLCHTESGEKLLTGSGRADQAHQVAHTPPRDAQLVARVGGVAL